MTNQPLNETTLLVAGELADIELPQAPLADWSGLFFSLGWTLLIAVLLILLLRWFFKSQLIKTSARQDSVLFLALVARWHLWKIKKALKANKKLQTASQTPSQPSSNSLTKPYLDAESFEAFIKAKTAVLFELSLSIQTLLNQADELASAKQLYSNQISPKNINSKNIDSKKLHSRLAQANIQSEALHKHLEFMLFSAPSASRETIHADFYKALQQAEQLFAIKPCWLVSKLRFLNHWRTFLTLLNARGGPS